MIISVMGTSLIQLFVYVRMRSNQVNDIVYGIVMLVIQKVFKLGKYPIHRTKVVYLGP